MKYKRKKHRSRIIRNSTNRGAIITGTIFVIAILVLMTSIGFMLVGGQLPTTRPAFFGSQVVVVTPASEKAKSNLQLYTFLGLTVTPTPPPPPTSAPPSGSTAPLQQPALCQHGGANDEAEILVGYSPAQGQSVGAGGQIKVWVNDEGAPIIAPGEQINSSTGQITTPGDRAAKAPDGYLWEPALYIAPQTAESGGPPHFPQYIKGDYNNTTSKGSGSNIPGMDPVPAGANLTEQYTAEDIWDVNSLGLNPGTYIAEFVIHDGDDNRGVGCVTITIQ
jgi:hypothetical protein